MIKQSNQEKFYQEHDRHYVAVDCIIFGFDGNSLKLLIQKRKFEPELNAFSLMGGFVKNEESAMDAANRILLQLTGLADVYLEQLYCFTNVNRDSAARTISIAYFALINIYQSNKLLVENHGAFWVDLNHCPKLIFDHDAMVQLALQRLRLKFITEPIAFNLLSNEFTLPNLQILYEAVYNRAFDKRLFRRCFLGTGLLIHLNVKDMSGSKKGAFLYQFDHAKYVQLYNIGLYFNLPIDKQPRMKVDKFK